MLLGYNHINSCEQFQHIKSLFQISLDEQNPEETLQISLCDVIFNNCVISDKADHCSTLLYNEALAIRRLKLQPNHGTKASQH